MSGLDNIAGRPISRRSLLARASVAAAVSLAPRVAFAESSGSGRLASFQDAKFGMFIHWGAYSVAGVEASWPVMRPDPRWPITEKDYVALPQRFNPSKFDADAFVDAARSAGQRYMVFTTKHHDGFCMFDSAYTDYKITRTPYGKDIVKLLADACERRGMPLGLYYSPPDMRHPGFRDVSQPISANWHGQPERSEWSSYLDYMELQLSELLTRYGKVRTIWFDGLNNQEKYDGRRFRDLIAQLQPDTLVNDRIGIQGDYITPEQFVPQGIPTKGLTPADLRATDRFRPGIPAASDFQYWETCKTMNRSWGYNPRDTDFTSAADLIRTLVEVAARGGNFLLNVGPKPDGTIPKESLDRLAAIGRWMGVNGEAIYGTLHGPIQGEAAYRTTAKDNLVFVHVFDWPPGSLTVRDFGRNVIAATALSSGRPVPFAPRSGAIHLDLSRLERDPDATVIKLTLS